MKTFYQLALVALMTISGTTEAAICANNAIAPGWCCTSDNVTLAQPYSAQGIFISLDCTQATTSATQFSCSGSRPLPRCAIKTGSSTTGNILGYTAPDS